MTEINYRVGRLFVLLVNPELLRLGGVDSRTMTSEVELPLYGARRSLGDRAGECINDLISCEARLRVSLNAYINVYFRGG